MYKYDKLKSHLNSSPTAYQFGKAVYMNQTPSNLIQYSLIWCSDLGASFRKQVIVSENSSTMQSNFVSNQNNEIYTFDHVQTFLSRKSGHYYSIQGGGMSNFHILVKTEAHETIEDVCWNTLRMLHTIRWIPSTDMEEKYNLNVANHVNNDTVTWLPAADKSFMISRIPDPDVHWVWFRKPGYHLTQEIVERASSWIVLNPGSKFHLWTDISTNDEVDDFLKNIKPDWLAQFRAATTIHLRDETYGVMETVMNTIECDETAEGLRILRAEFESPERQAQVFKTDFFRLFVLWLHGGIYTDFNDLLCLGPIKEAMAIYGMDQPLGVTDLYDLNHASNYFMYCPARDPHWMYIMKEMIKHFVYLIRMIRDAEMEACVLKGVLKALESCASPTPIPQSVTELQTMYRRHELPYIGNEHINDGLWERILFVILVDCVPDPYKGWINARLDQLKRGNRRQRGGRGGGAADSVFQTLSAEQITELRDVIDGAFHKSFLFWWVDYNLRVLMHYTNLPIYCRMRKIPLSMLPFGYYFNYCCMLSYVGHIGDGTSYGMDGRKDVHIENTYKDIQ
jgi:mannosyltransferase OCH1-like enzyme